MMIQEHSSVSINKTNSLEQILTGLLHGGEKMRKIFQMAKTT